MEMFVYMYSLALTLAITVCIRPARASIYNSLRSIGNETEGVWCHCTKKHPGTRCYACYSPDGSFFEENCCGDSAGDQKCVTKEVPFPYGDFVAACRLPEEKDVELDLCLDRESTENVTCRCNTDYQRVGLIDCFGPDGCLFERHFCDYDQEECTATGSEEFRFGEWFHGCRTSAERDYKVCLDRSDPTGVRCRCRGVGNSYDCFKEDGCLFERLSCPVDHECVGGDAYFDHGNVTSGMCHPGFVPTRAEASSTSKVLEGEDAYFYCVRPGSISCRMTKVHPALSTSVLSLGVFALPYSTHYGAFYSKVLKHDMVLGEPFQSNFTESTYGVFLTISKADGEEYNIFSDGYLNALKEGFSTQYDSSNYSTRFIISGVQDLLPEQESLVELQCTGFRPSVLFKDAAFDDRVDSCPRDYQITTQFRSGVWPPITSHGQGYLKTMALLSFVSGFLSMTGSSLLMYMISRKWYRSRTPMPRERILLGLSSLDFISSIAMLLGPIPSPPSAIQAPWTFGNTATCEAQGWAIQMGFGVPLYNSSLCIYFLMVLVFHRDPVFGISRVAEAFMHFIPLGFSFSTAISGLALDLFNTNGRICWIEASPYDCKWNKIIECTRGSQGDAFLWVFGGAPVFSAFVCIFISMVWISVSVARQYKCLNRNDMTTKGREGSSIAFNIEHVKKSVEFKLPRKREENSWSVYVQALLFVLSFLLTYIFVFLIYLAQWTKLNVGSWVHLAARFFWPLQGFWNFFIAIRPTYSRLRRRNPKMCFLKVMVEAYKLEMSESDNQVSSSRAKRNSMIVKALQKQQSRSFELRSSDLTSNCLGSSATSNSKVCASTKSVESNGS